MVGLLLALILGVVLNGRSQPPVTVPVNLSPAFSETLQSMTTITSGDGTISPQDLLGHLPYAEAPPETLRPIVADQSILLREAAADSYLTMVADAQAAGVQLVALSGYRSLELQEELFFDVKAQRGQAATERAEVSAPPGYSEHHTGYAIDIGDATRPETDLQVSFERTPAFRWLQQNSAYYSFELSFPRNNPQGVNYEPWHWRFVGDRHSLETFYQARNQE
jgi:D-alanyl-D-alanine carboxypeptidase